MKRVGPESPAPRLWVNGEELSFLHSFLDDKTKKGERGREDGKEERRRRELGR